MWRLFKTDYYSMLEDNNFEIDCVSAATIQGVALNTVYILFNSHLFKCHNGRGHVSSPAMVTLGADLPDVTISHHNALKYGSIWGDPYSCSYQYSMFSLEYMRRRSSIGSI